MTFMGPNWGLMRSTMLPLGLQLTFLGIIMPTSVSCHLLQQVAAPWQCPARKLLAGHRILEHCTALGQLDCGCLLTEAPNGVGGDCVPF